MQVKDLGELEGDILIFGGPYSNLQATKALIAVAKDRGIACDHMICTGDVVAYCAEPAETLAEITTHGIATVAGNCEKQLAAKAPDCGCGFDAGTACDLLSAGWYNFARKHITDHHRAWMAACPDIITFRHHGQSYAVIHGGVTDIARFIWSNSAPSVFREECAELARYTGFDTVIAGHSGIGFQRQIGDLRWINAGVIGMPPNAGNPDTEYLTLCAGTARLHRLSYDAAKAARRMQHAGLTQGYDTALITGIWPSQDVLPPALKILAA